MRREMREGREDEEREGRRERVMDQTQKEKTQWVMPC